MKNNLSKDLKTALKSNKKLFATSLALGMLVSGVSAFASTSVIPATVTVKDEPILAAAVTSSSQDGNLHFEMFRGDWDTEQLTIENTGNVDFYPEITYDSTEQNKFDGSGANITQSEKLILKSGDGTIYDFSAPTPYLPNGTTKISSGEQVSATIQVGAGKNVPDTFVEPVFNVNVNLKQE